MECQRLYDLIRQYMWRWGKRMILGLRGYDSFTRADHFSGRQWRALANRAKRRDYAKRREAGMTSYQAKHETKAAVDRRAQRERERWGGKPVAGNRAWVERESWKLAKKLQAL